MPAGAILSLYRTAWRCTTSSVGRSRLRPPVRTAWTLSGAAAECAAPVVRDLVLIHGLMDSTEGWLKSIDVLAQTHRVWAIDLIGFGFSSRLAERVFTLKSYSRWVSDFMNVVEIGAVAVVGHSLGGGISLQLAHDAPSRIDKLVLIAPAAYWWFPRPVQLAARIPVLPRELLRLALNSRRAHFAVWSAAVGDSTTPDAIQIATRERHLRVKGTLDTLVAMAGSPCDSDLPAGIKYISVPTLILWGEEDTGPSCHTRQASCT